jgi:acetyl-CoA C-acetyltransferase
MIANAYMHRYKATRKHLAAVAVKNHHNGSLNPYAQFPGKITINDVLNATMVADPITVMDSSPVSDGAACVILCSGDMAKRLKKPMVRIKASGAATDTLALHQRADITSLKAVQRAAQNAYKMAGVRPRDINLAEVHDCFTIAEICIIEELGFVGKGKGAEFTKNSETSLRGKIPINTSGGLKSKGHPVGATGVAQAIEVVEQLRGTADKRQIKNARIGLTQNMGGSGASSVVHIFQVL